MLYYYQPRHPSQVFTDAPKHRNAIAKPELVSGYGGISKMYYHVANHCYWPNINHDVIEYVNQCTDCKLQKPDTNPPQVIPGYDQSRSHGRVL